MGNKAPRWATLWALDFIAILWWRKVSARDEGEHCRLVVRDIHGSQRSPTVSLGTWCAPLPAHYPEFHYTRKLQEFHLSNPAFHSADHLCRLLLNSLLLGLVFLGCYPGTLEGCTWDKTKGSVSFLRRQVVWAVILPGLSPCIKENIPLRLLFLFSGCHCRYYTIYKPSRIFQWLERHHSSWKERWGPLASIHINVLDHKGFKQDISLVVCHHIINLPALFKAESPSVHRFAEVVCHAWATFPLGIAQKRVFVLLRELNIYPRP